MARDVIRPALLLFLFGVLGTACTVRSREPGAPPPVAAPREAAPAAAAPAVTPGAGESVIAAPLAPGTDSAAYAAIRRAGGGRSPVVADLRYLSDVIGPRLTGSAALRRANEWAAARFRQHGADSAWLEPWRFGRAWERGPMTLTMHAPHQRQIIGAASWGWAPGTNGPLAGDLIYVDAAGESEFAARFAGKLRGAWVMTRPPAPVWNPDGPPMTTADSMAMDSARRALAPPATPAGRAWRASLPQLLAQEGAAGLLVDGAKEFGLLTMSGSPAAPWPLPQVVVPHDSYTLFHRLVDARERVRLEADIVNTLTRDTVTAFNTIAEIRGRELPDEIVLLGAHLDSWDLASGTSDNAAGVVAVMEAARLLAASGVRPRRTIRFALFTGEEQGLYGSTAYVAAHDAELARLQAVLVLDNGTGRITGIALQGRDELRELWQSLLAPVAAPLGPLAVRSAEKGGTDHLPFLRIGVPAFNFDQLSRGYGHTHHSQLDGFDAAVPADVQQAARVMATVAYGLAQLPALIARSAPR